MRILLSMLFVLVHGLNAGAQSNGREGDLNATAFKAKMEATPGHVLIDLRTPEEFNEGVIGNPQYLDYFEKDFERRIEQLDKSKVYFLYCASGVRSGETKELMEKKGFTGVYHLETGFAGWKKAKLPIARFSRQ